MNGDDLTWPIGALVMAAHIGCLIFAAFRALPPLVAAENRARDLAQALLYPKQPQRDDIAIVLIDEATLAKLSYRSPIDRAFLASLVARLRGLGTKAIAIDLLVDQPTEEAKDFPFLDVIEAEGAPVIMAVADEKEGLLQAQNEFLAAMTELVRTGQAGLYRDPVDFVTRGVPATRDIHNRQTPSFAVAMAQAGGLSAPGDSFEIAYSPTEEGIDFVPRLSAGFSNFFTEEAVKDRRIFIGVDLAGIDRHRTPLLVTTDEADRPGVESHAHALAQLIDGRTLGQASLRWMFAATVLASLLTAAALVMKTPVVIRLALALVIIAVFAATPVVAMTGFAVRVPFIPPLAGAVIAGAVVALARWRKDSLTLKRLREAFGKYVSPTVVGQIESNPGALALGGERREMTCVFTDVAGFTTLCENFPANKLITLLNRYLGGASNVVVDHGGTIDKFVGDAIVSFFGAPLDRPDQAAAAIRMVVDLDRFASEFVETVAAEGTTFGVTRIGVHTGEATVGNFGGDVFFDYTAMGDKMNVAARLEGANKAYGGHVTISGDALAHAGGAVDGVLTRPIGRLRVKGRDEPLATYEAFAPDDPRATYVTDYMAAYERLCSDGSAEGFAPLASRHPNDALISFDAARHNDGERGEVVTLKEK